MLKVWISWVNVHWNLGAGANLLKVRELRHLHAIQPHLGFKVGV